MPVATTISTPSHHHHRTQVYPSHSLRYQAYEGGPKSTVSDSSQSVVVGGLRRVLAGACKSPSEERRLRAKGAMTSHTPRRTYSDSKTNAKETYGKEPRVAVREVRRKSDSEHRHHHRRSEKEDAREGERVYVYKAQKKSEGEADRSRPSSLRRSTTNAGEASRTRHERQRTGDRELQTRHSERRPPHHEEKTHTPLRREKRSIADYVPKSTRDKAPVTRPPLKRSQTSARQARPLSSDQPTSPPVREKLERAPSTTRGTRPAARPSSILGSIFGLPTPAKPVPPARPPKPEQQVECITCLSDDVPISKTALLPCKHRMCNACLRRLFTLSTTDPQHMPPTCCTKDCIDLKHVDKLFDNNFKRKWNRKYQEYTTKNRIYCPARGCGSWIKPAHIHVDTSGGANGGRKYGKCQRCKTKVCCTCNNKWHSSRECPKDAATQEFIKVAKEEGWQRCFNCSATVELKEGCNHMTCRCRAEFCMICGLKWKTCDCPWFNYEAVEADRLIHMNVPQIRRAPIGNPARGYQEELDRRRDQELRDEAFARRIQILGLDGEADLIDLDNAPYVNAAPHRTNEDWIRRAAEVLSALHNPAHERAAERLTAEARPQHRRPAPAPAPPPVEPPLRPHAPPRPPEPALRQQHSAASRQYNNRPTTRASERVVPRRVVSDYATEAARHRPLPPGGVGAGATGETRRESLLAGIVEGRTAEGRVAEWRRHVGPLV
ncbi:hypothetical protein HO133_001643 [Letharia lupina]|uniref:RBR-type E3 ubiquitin transferase n=1 Tax=Letharia lupina TaxID=560253 RepID=A0A8H6FAX1_9LECA|nr:uncharacterized protein HO133_001643 [Letharia lupina]KAF6221675.1 hypothetical protein HO133_001643 [Letharia lupina]